MNDEALEQCVRVRRGWKPVPLDKSDRGEGEHASLVDEVLPRARGRVRYPTAATASGRRSATLDTRPYCKVSK
jgi:hypothetical protein